MKSKEMNLRILKITAAIREEHPELSKYIDEMPEIVPTDPGGEVTEIQLKEYFDSLNSLLTSYTREKSTKDLRQ